ncbi:DNA-3-methyladenine glycosylase [Pelodictyon luteolum]|uniref:Putative 3-methyladenine DNA glycosylase n=1 Tax=Chlorobium luteolum (strain DSM 273 / BCRC 81028 / 2530) TaxID=319225 RepID=3MGH_CHLL3|nr:DNA-3-methyladenine glycosylase [Pelodictyon luteolum]Q3B622.1 RecName: Full=Putative 3-methyladenine DNA glycosylase [Pelodictyon luteolum DSM 273]ABB23209.1 Methylpurine-DNA glycosylase (MPG) [Pelodictyon luteolum DSM 273]
MTRLGKQFFTAPTLALTERLLGKIFVRITPSGTVLKGRIVETEAYLGHNDEACHAWRKKTERNRVMFEAPGTLYVYFSYGCHHLLNIVTEPEGTAGAVLIRAMEPVEGIPCMQERRQTTVETALMSGPAKLTSALGVERSSSGRDLFGNEFFLLDAPSPQPSMICTSTRVGISRSRELPWRKYLADSPHVSKGRPS